MSSENSSRKVFEKEGYFYAVPLWTRGYGLALVLRGGRGKDMFCCLFNQKFDEFPRSAGVQELTIAHAYLSCRVFREGIYNGCWPLVCECSSYRRDDWPLPFFRSTDAVMSTRKFDSVVRYDEFGEIIERRKIPLREIDSYDLPGYYGHGLIEKWLTVYFEEGLSRDLAEMEI
jgi:Immunity protein 26